VRTVPQYFLRKKLRLFLLFPRGPHLGLMGSIPHLLFLRKKKPPKFLGLLSKKKKTVCHKGQKGFFPEKQFHLFTIARYFFCRKAFLPFADQKMIELEST